MFRGYQILLSTLLSLGVLETMYSSRTGLSTLRNSCDGSVARVVRLSHSITVYPARITVRNALRNQGVLLIKHYKTKSLISVHA